MPQSVLPSASNYDLPMPAPTPAPSAADNGSMDLDLDLDVVAPPAAPGKPMDSTQPLAPFDMPGLTPAVQRGDAKDSARDTAARLADLRLPTGEANAASTTTAAAFDFGSLSLDLGSSGKAVNMEPALDYSSMPAAFADAPDLPGDASDPLVRKLELAEEFRQIGDKDGARDLLEEVVAKASGPLKARAQSLLDGLA